jgi:hypothetical protein
MSLFDTQFAACALPAMMTHFGDATLYIPPDGDVDLPVTAMWGPEQSEIVETADGRIEQRTRQITIGRDADSPFGGIADPPQKGAFSLAGEIWAIAGDGALEKTAATITFKLIHAAPIEVGRHGYERLRR